MCVIVPADAKATTSLLTQATEINGPFYIRIGTDYAPTVYIDDEPSIGRVFCLRDGKDITLLACGVTVSFALEAAEHLRKKGVDAGVADVHTIKPLDREAIIKALHEIEVPSIVHSGGLSWDATGEPVHPVAFVWELKPNLQMEVVYVWEGTPPYQTMSYDEYKALVVSLLGE